MKFVAAARTSLGIPTIFNLLGPLTNPGRARHQLLGVFAPELTDRLAAVLRELGSERAWVVHADDGLDELSTLGPTRVSELHDGDVRTFHVDPARCRPPLRPPVRPPGRHRGRVRQRHPPDAPGGSGPGARHLRPQRCRGVGGGGEGRRPAGGGGHGRRGDRERPGGADARIARPALERSGKPRRSRRGIVPAMCGALNTVTAVSFAIALFAAFAASTSLGNGHPDFELRPSLALLAVSSALPILRLADRLRRAGVASRQSRLLCAGLCRRCGYDLRGLISCCPECGAPARRAGPVAAVEITPTGARWGRKRESTTR